MVIMFAYSVCCHVNSTGFCNAFPHICPPSSNRRPTHLRTISRTPAVDADVHALLQSDVPARHRNALFEITQPVYGIKELTIHDYHSMTINTNLHGTRRDVPVGSMGRSAAPIVSNAE